MEQVEDVADQPIDRQLVLLEQQLSAISAVVDVIEADLRRLLHGAASASRVEAQ
jgi:hypothetical protein